MLGGTSNDAIGGLVSTASNQLYLAGRFSSASISFGDTTLSNSATATSDAFITKLIDFKANPNSVSDAENTPTSIKFWPNPASQTLSIMSVGNNIQQVLISNSLGKQVYTTEYFLGLITVDVSQLANGLYYLSALSNNQNLQTVKFVVAK
jgi:hypothetical protein